MQITVWKSLIGSQTKGAIIRDVRTDGRMYIRRSANLNANYILVQRQF